MFNLWIVFWNLWINVFVPVLMILKKKILLKPLKKI